MGRKRKSVDQRRQEKADQERRAWESFRPRLAELKTFAEAVELVNSGPRPDAPGRQYHSNLGFFLGSFAPPGGASAGELVLYKDFIRRIERELKPGAADSVLQGLDHAIAQRRSGG